MTVGFLILVTPGLFEHKYDDKTHGHLNSIDIMLRISRDDEDYSASPVDFNVFTGLRPCPSVADLFDLDTIEEYRLETETGMLNE